MLRFGGGTCAYAQHVAGVCGQHNRARLMGFEFISQCLPASVHVLVEQSFLDGHKQVVCQQTEEYVCIDAPLELMMYGWAAASAGSSCREMRSRRG